MMGIPRLSPCCATEQYQRNEKRHDGMIFWRKSKLFWIIQLLAVLLIHCHPSGHFPPLKLFAEQWSWHFRELDWNPFYISVPTQGWGMRLWLIKYWPFVTQKRQPCRSNAAMVVFFFSRMAWKRKFEVPVDTHSSFFCASTYADWGTNFSENLKVIKFFSTKNISTAHEIMHFCICIHAIKAWAFVGRIKMIAPLKQPISSRRDTHSFAFSKRPTSVADTIELWFLKTFLSRTDRILTSDTATNHKWAHGAKPVVEVYVQTEAEVLLRAFWEIKLRPVWHYSVLYFGVSEYTFTAIKSMNKVKLTAI